PLAFPRAIRDADPERGVVEKNAERVGTDTDRCARGAKARHALRENERQAHEQRLAIARLRFEPCEQLVRRLQANVALKRRLYIMSHGARAPRSCTGSWCRR